MLPLAVDVDLPPILFRDNDVNDFPPVSCKSLNYQSYVDFNIPSNAISFINVNIRSCRKNFAFFESFLSCKSRSFDFIALTETWLVQNEDHCFNIEGYKKFNIYRSKHGGGIAIYGKSHYDINIVDCLSFITDEVEILTLRVISSNDTFYFSCVYRPPSFSIDSFNDILSNNILPHFANRRTVICGDFNVNLFNPLNSNNVDNFISVFASFNFYPVIDQPTRFSPENVTTKFSLLDQIWLNFNPGNINSAVVLIDISDHMPVLCHFILNCNEIKNSFYSCRKFNDPTNVNNFVTDINQTDFYDCDYNDPEVLTNNFLSKIYKAFNKNFPLRKYKENKRHFRRSDWMTDDLKQLVKKKHVLLKQANRGIIFRRCYTYFRNVLNSLIKKIKCLYNLTKLNENVGNPKNTWHELNRILDRSPKNNCIELKKDSIKVEEGEMVNMFNCHFSSIAQRLVNELPLINDIFTIHSPRNSNVCNFDEITVTEVKEVILSFKNKNVNKNEIKPFLLCEIANYISPVLCKIFNDCVNSCIYPDNFKIARVVPVYKSGDNSNVNNFRPISTLPVFSKMYESLISSRLSDFIESENILTNHQYAFRKNCSTTLAILELTSNILKSFNEKSYTVALFLDLSKAFDTIDKSLLLKKLDHYGVRGSFNDFLSSYLSNRKQFVQYNDFNSDYKPITTGLMQGSILSTILFNIFFNDISHMANSHNFKCTLFADDAVFYFKSESFIDAINGMRSFIDILSKWLVLNKLTPNTSKTKLMIFTPCVIEQQLPELFFNNTVLEWVEHFKYLGVLLDNKLTFKYHIKELCNKLSKVRGILYASSPFLNRKCSLLVYFSLGYSLLSQSIILFGGNFDTVLEPVRVILNNILRVILKVRKDENGIPLMHINDMYFSLGLLKFDDIYKYFLLKFLRRAIFDDADLFNVYFSPLVPTHNYPTRRHLNIPPIRVEIERHSPIYQAVGLFNSVPSFLLEPMTDLKFKRVFKEYCMSGYL